MKGKVFLLGIDGASWNIIQTLIEDGRLTNFREICQNGIIGILNSTTPPMSLPAWNSIFTGVNPGKHGIPDSIVKINEQIMSVINSKIRTIPTLWEYLSNKDADCIIINDPVSYPPLKIKGVHMTGFLTPPTSTQFIYPIKLKESIKSIKKYIPEIPKNYYSMIKKDLNAALEMALATNKTQEDVAISLFRNFNWRLFNFTITLTDRVSHYMWHKKELIGRAYNYVDTFLGQVLNFCSSEDTDLIIVSDHGFEALNYFFYINNWLMDNGFISKKLRRIFQRYQGYIFKHFIRMVPFLNFVNKFQTSQKLPNFSTNDMALSFGSGSIFLNYLQTEQMKRKITNILIRKLKNVKHRDKIIFERIFRKEDILWGPYVSRAGDILLSFAKYYDIHTGFLGWKLFDESWYVLQQVKRSGKHSTFGIFIGYGPNIIKDKQIRYLVETWDIAPTLLHMLGLPIPSYMDGRVLKEIFKEGSKPAIQAVKITYPSKYERVLSRIREFKKRKYLT